MSCLLPGDCNPSRFGRWGGGRKSLSHWEVQYRTNHREEFWSWLHLVLLPSLWRAIFFSILILCHFYCVFSLWMVFVCLIQYGDFCLGSTESLFSVWSIFASLNQISSRQSVTGPSLSKSHFIFPVAWVFLLGCPIHCPSHGTNLAVSPRWPALTTNISTWSWDFSLVNCGPIGRICCLIHPGCGIWLWQPWQVSTLS